MAYERGMRMTSIMTQGEVLRDKRRATPIVYVVSINMIVEVANDDSYL
jgi:hypothetical protein